MVMTYGSVLPGSQRAPMNASFGYVFGVVNGLAIALLAVGMSSMFSNESGTATQKQSTLPVLGMEPEPVQQVDIDDTSVQNVNGKTVKLGKAHTMVQHVLPAIVTIISITEIDVAAMEVPLGITPDGQFQYEKINATKQNQTALGTGVVIQRPAGPVIVTAAHVVAGPGKIDEKQIKPYATYIFIRDTEDKTYTAETKRFNGPHDLAELTLTGGCNQASTEGCHRDEKIEVTFAGKSVALELADVLKTGDSVMAIGNNMGLGIATTSGIVSAVGKQTVELSDNSTIKLPVYQTDASINHGNSGGALVEATTGKVCGITNSIVSSNGGNIGIGFAITASTVDKFLKGDLKNGELMPPAPEVSGGGGYGGSGTARKKQEATLNFGRKSVEGDTNPFAFPRRVVAETDGFPKVTKWL
jgi:S1-C subfamily serine protease